jgi:hypothetical protein
MEKPVIRQDIIERALRAIIENESNEITIHLPKLST